MFSHSAESSHKSKLVLRVSTADNLERANDLIEPLLVGEGVGVDWFLAFLRDDLALDDFADHFSELFGVHCNGGIA